MRAVVAAADGCPFYFLCRNKEFTMDYIIVSTISNGKGEATTSMIGPFGSIDAAISWAEVNVDNPGGFWRVERLREPNGQTPTATFDMPSLNAYTAGLILLGLTVGVVGSALIRVAFA